MALTDKNMNNKPLTKEEREQDLIRYGIRMAAITIMVVMGFFSSCTMMPDFEFVDQDAAATATAKADGQVKIAKQKHLEEMAKIAAIERLIKEHKVNPIAARCAINGWDKHTPGCDDLVKANKGSITITTGEK